jgi:hypothetical protein
MERKTDKENIIGQTLLDIKEIGWIMSFMEKVIIIGQIKKFIREIGREIICMVPEKWNFQTVKFIKVILEIIIKKDKAYSYGQTVNVTMEVGRIINNMAKQNSQIRAIKAK